MRAVSPPAPAADDLETPRVVLRDGSVASVRVAGPADRQAVEQFFLDLSPESRYRRFSSTSAPSSALLDRLCDGSDRRRSLALLASRGADGSDHLIAVASYAAMTDTTAEVAFAVADSFQGRGISTLLLERLAAYAAREGFQEFWATTPAENAAMLAVFRESGFDMRSTTASGHVDLQLSVALSDDGVAAGERRRRQATVESLTPILRPRSVAVIGASRDERKIGGRILRAVVSSHFRGSLYAVNPEADEVFGIRAFRSPRELPPDVDLAVITIPAAGVDAAVDACALAGVRALVVITAGFAEVGSEGREAQDRLVRKVRGYGMRMIGPNCMGVINMAPSVSLNASFSPLTPPPGGVAFSSQSGALGIVILELAAERQLGLSAFVSVGNKADVSGNDLLEYWEADPDTRVILLYLESFGNPRRFARIARRIGHTKPIIALKAGRTRAGSRAAGSHTAALASNETAVSALFRQTGVIRAETIDEMFDIAACLETQPLPKGPRIAVVTNAGGPGILAADACEAAGLVMADLSEATHAAMAAVLPRTAALGNPVDMVAGAGPVEYRATVGAAMADPGVDALLVIYTPIEITRSADILASIEGAVADARAAGITDKPVLACAITGRPQSAPLRTPTESIPTYAFPENAVRALGRIASYAGRRAQPAGQYWDFEDIRARTARAICDRVKSERGGGWLTTDETWDVLRAFGVPMVDAAIAHDAEEAVSFAVGYGWPVAAKVASLQLQHKTDVGGVRLGISTPADMRAAFTELAAVARGTSPDPAGIGVLIQPMASGGIETMIGVVHDPLFGPLIGFGLGGITVELFGDIGFRIAPLTDRDADELIHEIRGARILTGYRGRPGADLVALRDVLLRVSRLAEMLPEVQELDLNPVMAFAPGQGCRVVDARIRIEA